MDLNNTQSPYPAFTPSGELWNSKYRGNALATLIPRISHLKEITKPSLEQGCLFCLSFHPQQNILAAARGTKQKLFTYSI